MNIHHHMNSDGHQRGEANTTWARADIPFEFSI